MALKIIWTSNIYKRFDLFSLIFNWFLDEIVKVLYKNWYGFTCVFSKILVLGGKNNHIFRIQSLSCDSCSRYKKWKRKRKRKRWKRINLYIYTYTQSAYFFRFFMPSSSLAASAFQTPQSTLKIINKRIMKRSHSHVSLVMSRFSIIHIIS